MDQGISLKEALKNVIGQKLLGTYRIAAMELSKPNNILFTKNSGDFFICTSKLNNEVILSSESSLFNTKSIRDNFNAVISIPNNQIVEVRETCEYSFEKIDKQIKIERNPKPLFDHIMHEEIIEGIDSIELVTDFGGKFISDHQVILGGFEKAKSELLLIEDLIIQGDGASRLASQYGAYIMR